MNRTCEVLASWGGCLLWPVFVEWWQAALGLLGTLVGAVVPVVLFWVSRRDADRRRWCFAWMSGCAVAWGSTLVGLAALAWLGDGSPSDRPWKYGVTASACLFGAVASVKLSKRSPSGASRWPLWFTVASVGMALSAYVAFGYRTMARGALRPPHDPDWADISDYGGG